MKFDRPPTLSESPRTHEPALHRLGTFALAAFAMAAMAYRLFNLDLTPFINDEAHFLEAARQQLLTGKWATASPISGSQGATYGPTAIWFYGAVQLLFGASVRTCTIAACVAITGGQVVLAGALTRLYRGGLALFATLVLLMAASPYSFFYARLAWDPFMLPLSAVVVAVMSGERPFSTARSLTLGLLLGACVSVHLNSLPFVALALGLLAVERLSDLGELLRTVGTTVVALLFFNIPYLIFLTGRPLPRVAPDLYNVPFLERFLQVPRVSSLQGIEVLFDDQWQAFNAFFPWPGGLGPTSQFLLWVLCAATVLGLLAALFGAPRERRIAVFALLVWFGYVAFYSWKRLLPHAHYQLNTWWIVPVGVGALLARASRVAPLARFANGSVWLLGGVQLAFIVAWMSFVRQTGGTRGLAYSTPAAAQAAAIRTVCTAPESTIFLENQTVILPVSLSYLARTEPTCTGKNLVLCAGPCPAVGGARTWTLAYARPTGGAVEVR